MKKKFIDAVESGNLISVRYSLSNELLLDPRGDSYREMKTLAEERMDGLYEPLDGELPQKPIEEYTEAELIEFKNDLDGNFSKERLELYEQIVAVVLHDKAKQMENKAYPDEETEQRMKSEDRQGASSLNNDIPKQKCKSKKKCSLKDVAISTAVGVGAFGIAKGVAATSTISAVGIGVFSAAAAGGLIKYIKDNDREDEEI